MIPDFLFRELKYTVCPFCKNHMGSPGLVTPHPAGCWFHPLIPARLEESSWTEMWAWHCPPWVRELHPLNVVMWPFHLLKEPLTTMRRTTADSQTAPFTARAPTLHPSGTYLITRCPSAAQCPLQTLSHPHWNHATPNSATSCWASKEKKDQTNSAATHSAYRSIPEN